jgi:type III secretory pathway lipoprotein EscJ
MSSSLTENARIDEQLAKALEDVYTLHIQGTIQHRVSTVSPIESRRPSSAQLYVFYSDIEARVNMRCCITEGLNREIVATI